MNEIEQPAREIRYLVIHCSATPCNRAFSVEDLRASHLKQGFVDIGYHFYILRDGTLCQCRPISQAGAHCRGFNRCSIGICYEGGLTPDGTPADTRTEAQREELRSLVTILETLFPGVKTVGHRDLCNGQKSCPCFDVATDL